MRAIKIIRIAINIYYYLLVGALALLSISILLDVLFPQKFKNNWFFRLPLFWSEIESNIRIAVTLFAMVMFLVLIRAVLFVKQSMPELAKGNVFSEKVIDNFDKSGKLFVLFGILRVCYKMSASYLKGEFLFNVTDFFIFIVLGFFFIFLSQAFLKGKELQQENDLTI